ncbi:chemotaxis protein W [Desulfosarcina ovata subsp. sediminis]|uniref:Chemotaxis protein W n=1 Tax=Desulfosarcina ovata subsp. sediminis TaxID=885957 RepID=A0A5K7ZKS5_9BACT|nr:chemotaxis protein CheW [Desulfosarcina ovata]BBO81974.1 chemotaxis protein W [Desulfosarcina ovata subsp. sediminis]
MDPTQYQEQRFASFILDREKGTEVAIDAKMVLEATGISRDLHPLATGADFLEGMMRLREDTIPVINLKKRLGLTRTDYIAEAKVAVVGISGFRFGLLVDDIRDVLMVSSENIHPIHPALLTEMSLITNLIKLQNGQRTLQLLDLQRLFGDTQVARQCQATDTDAAAAIPGKQRTFSRFVAFTVGDQHYGIPVERAQEITFLSEIDKTFKSDSIEGSLDLRGHTIPVINAAHLFQQKLDSGSPGVETRVLVLDSEEFQYGLIVDRICEIIGIADDEVMCLPHSGNSAVSGVYQQADGSNIMLIRVNELIGDQQQGLRSVARLKSRVGDDAAAAVRADTRHLITADCYLVFSIGKKFAVELNDVQEIIEPTALMNIPAAGGVDQRVLNLRGNVIPVVNLRCFYQFDTDEAPENPKLIIAKHGDQLIAMEVDQILTIYKQVQFQKTPSLNPKFSGKQDTLDRLIEFADESGITEHVLVINVGAMMNNHLGLSANYESTTDQATVKENSNANNAA